MYALTIPNMFREDMELSKEKPNRKKRGQWRRLPQNLNNRDLLAKLCGDSSEYCQGCDCLSKCMFGQTAVERGI